MTCLVDTFDTHRGIRRAAEAVGERLAGVRIDSGDLGALARGARGILDEAGLNRARIVVSDDLDENKIAALLGSGAPIDAFGVGTMAVSPPDHPSLGAVYKLVGMDSANGELVAVQKRAPGKGSHAAPKQVFRGEGSLDDVVGLAGEEGPGVPVLVPVMDQGRLLLEQTPQETLAAARSRFASDRSLASPSLLSLAPRSDQEGFPVSTSEALREAQLRVEAAGRAVVPRAPK